MGFETSDYFNKSRAAGDPLWYQREPLAPEDAAARKIPDFPPLELMVWQTYNAAQIAKKMADLYDLYEWRVDSVPKTHHLRIYVHYALKRRHLVQLGTKRLVDRVINKIMERVRARGKVDPRPVSVYHMPGDPDHDPRREALKPNPLRRAL